MANVVSGDPLVIDTATATGFPSGILEVYGIFWASATAADTCVIKQTDGQQKWSALGTQAPPHFVGQGVTFNGIQVPTLTAGTLYIYLNQWPKAF